jgi:hypothetical protein
MLAFERYSSGWNRPRRASAENADRCDKHSLALIGNCRDSTLSIGSSTEEPPHLRGGSRRGDNLVDVRRGPPKSHVNSGVNLWVRTETQWSMN